MNFYIVPIIPTTVGPDTFLAPKYLEGADFTSISFGVEGVGIVSTPLVVNQPDVFAFPSDLTAALSDSDVQNLDDFCAPLNIPTAFAAEGMLWSDVLRQLCQIALVCQAVSGSQDGAPIFPSGITVDSTITSQSKGNTKLGGTTATPSALATAVGTTTGPFDLTDVDDTQTVGDVLLSVSQQFTEPISLGSEVI